MSSRKLSRSSSGPKSEPGSESLNWFLKPHEIIALVLSVSAVIYFVFTRDVNNTEDNVKAGITAAAIMFLVFCATEMRDTGFMKRPHPVIWRIFKGTTILYLVGCIWLLFQKPEDARRVFAFIDPSLGKPLPDRSYAEDCRIYTPGDPRGNFANVWDVIFDEFVIAHTLGWIFKMFMFRDVYVSWFLSIWFELLEYSFQHILLNFAECWWDHWIVDVLICNALGIWIGSVILKKIESPKYDWIEEPEPEQPKSYLARIVAQFKPETWINFKWRVLRSPRRWFGFWTLVTMVSIGELNAFFLKYVLWHPPPHPIVSLRLVIWFTFSLPAVRELYSYVNDPKQKRIGAFLWLTIAIAASEALISIRFSEGQFPHLHGHPPVIVGLWTVFIVGINLFTILYFFVFKSHLKNGKEIDSAPPSPDEKKAPRTPRLTSKAIKEAFAKNPSEPKRGRRASVLGKND